MSVVEKEERFSFVRRLVTAAFWAIVRLGFPWVFDENGLLVGAILCDMNYCAK
jgi:hypothetical protein